MLIPGESQRRNFRDYRLIRRLTSNFDVSKTQSVQYYADSYDGGQGNDDIAAFRTSDLDDTIKCIRQLIGTMRPGNDQVRENALHQIELLQGRRDRLVLAEFTTSQKRVDFEEVIRVVMASGLLRNAERVREAFHYALQVSVKDKVYRKYLEEQLAKMSSCHPSVIIRNRLIVHMALNLHTQRQLEDIAEKCQYMVFRTLDLTPERGWEWVDHVVIIKLFALANCQLPTVPFVSCSKCATLALVGCQLENRTALYGFPHSSLET